jgi:hypothetical protein
MNGLIGNAILEFWVCAYVSHIAWQRGHHGIVVGEKERKSRILGESRTAYILRRFTMCLRGF